MGIDKFWKTSIALAASGLIAGGIGWAAGEPDSPEPENPPVADVLIAVDDAAQEELADDVFEEPLDGGERQLGGPEGNPPPPPPPPPPPRREGEPRGEEPEDVIIQRPAGARGGPGRPVMIPLDGRRGGPPGPPDGRGLRGAGRRPGGPQGELGPPRGPGAPGRAANLEPLDPELAELLRRDQELERASREMAERYRHLSLRGKGEEREKALAELKKELAEIVGKHFNVRQDRREMEVRRIGEHLDRLRGQLKKRGDQKEQIIDRRVSQLTGEEDADF